MPPTTRRRRSATPPPAAPARAASSRDPDADLRRAEGRRYPYGVPVEGKPGFVTSPYAPDSGIRGCARLRARPGGPRPVHEENLPRALTVTEGARLQSGDRLAIFGPGLIGGSLALAARRREHVRHRSSLWSRDAAERDAARRLGLPDTVVTGDAAEAVCGSAAGRALHAARRRCRSWPPGRSRPHLEPGAVVSDVASVKAGVVGGTDRDLRASRRQPLRRARTPWPGPNAADWPRRGRPVRAVASACSRRSTEPAPTPAALGKA